MSTPWHPIHLIKRPNRSKPIMLTSFFSIETNLIFHFQQIIKYNWETCQTNIFRVNKLKFKYLIVNSIENFAENRLPAKFIYILILTLIKSPSYASLDYVKLSLSRRSKKAEIPPLAELVSFLTHFHEVIERHKVPIW